MPVQNLGAVNAGTTLSEGSRSFDAHFRSLVLGSLQHFAAAESELQLARGHRLRARRAARRAHELELAFSSAGAASGNTRPAAKRATRMAVVATIVLLVAVVRFAGVTSAWTGAADVALIGVTVAWFLVDSRPVREPAARGRAGAEVDEVAASRSG